MAEDCSRGDLVACRFGRRGARGGSSFAELRRRSPRTPIFVSTSTLAGRETAGHRLSGLAEGIFYAPIDYVWMVRRVLRRIRPSVVVVLETEIWPNLFRERKRIGCGLVMVNGRIS